MTGRLMSLDEVRAIRQQRLRDEQGDISPEEIEQNRLKLKPLIDAYYAQLITGDHAEVDQLEQAEPGICDDCGKQAAHTNTAPTETARLRYGNVTVCRDHAISRLKTKGKILQEQPQGSAA